MAQSTQLLLDPASSTLLGCWTRLYKRPSSSCAVSPPSALKAPRGLTLETPLSFMYGRCQPQDNRTHSFFCTSSDSDAIQAETGCTPARAASGAIPLHGSAVFPLHNKHPITITCIIITALMRI